MPNYTTAQAAKKLGISRATLQEWISSGKVGAPKNALGKGTVRIWTEADLARLRRDKQRLYRMNMGRPRKGKG